MPQGGGTEEQSPGVLIASGSNTSPRKASLSGAARRKRRRARRKVAGTGGSQLPGSTSQLASLSDPPVDTPGVGNRTRSAISTPSSEEVRPAKRTQSSQPGHILKHWLLFGWPSSRRAIQTPRCWLTKLILFWGGF